MSLRPIRFTVRPIEALLILIGCVLLFSGCTRNEEAQAKAPVRPVKSLVVETPDLSGERNLPGRVDAKKTAELAFRVSGAVQTLKVKEGDKVDAGQVLIVLDPTDYEIAVRDAQATFDRTENDFKRAQELVEDSFISLTDYDAKEAEFKNATAALERAKQDLVYPELKASFPGTISRRHVERFEAMQAKQAVLAMQDNDTL
jgi:RND family efflux transporter MFP subunit